MFHVEHLCACAPVRACAPVIYIYEFTFINTGRLHSEK